MVLQLVGCSHCQSDDVKGRWSHRRWQAAPQMQELGRISRDSLSMNATMRHKRSKILCTYHERSLIRGIQRIFGVSRPTLINWLKKDREMWCGPSPLTRVQESVAHSGRQGAGVE